MPHARLSEIHPDWPKVAWIDSDVNFERDDIMDETRHALAHYDVVQMWSHAQDMGPENEPLPDMGRFRFFFPHRASARPRARRRLQETTRSRLAISTWTATPAQAWRLISRPAGGQGRRSRTDVEAVGPAR